MVNYGNSPSSLRVLSARVSASFHARTADGSHVSALQAPSGSRGNAPRRGHTKVCFIRPAAPTRSFPQSLPHKMPFRADMGVVAERCVRQQSRRGAQRLSARGMTNLRSCSLSYFISHSLLCGPVLRVATGLHSALSEREKKWRQQEQPSLGL